MAGKVLKPCYHSELMLAHRGTLQGLTLRPMVCFVNVASVDRIIYAIFNGYNQRQEWRNRTLRLFTHAA